MFLAQSILRRRQDARVGQHRPAGGEESRGLRRHVLELVGDGFHIVRKPVESLDIAVVRAGDTMHHIEGA